MSDQSSTGFASLAMVNIDCADPVALAAFYSELLGWKIAHSQPEYSMLANPVEGGGPIGFGQVENYVPPVWPNANGSKQFHLDFLVADVAEAEARCLKLGASKPAHQPGENWQVMLDPAGHPFCLCPKS